MRKTLQISVITFLAFTIYVVLDELYFRAVRNGLNYLIRQGGCSHIIAYALSGVPILIGTILIHRLKGCMRSLGFGKSLWKAICITFLFCLPMFVGFAFVFPFNSEITIDDLLIQVLAAAFFEELFFRAFLFGQLFRYTQLGFLPSVILGALWFGSIHLYQSRDFFDAAGIFAITFLGGIFFAWLYAEWDYDLWIPVGMHFFMNLSWLLFSASENALGGIYFNIFRTFAILLAITFTLMYKKKRGMRLEVGKQTLWWKLPQ